MSILLGILASYLLYRFLKDFTRENSADLSHIWDEFERERGGYSGMDSEERYYTRLIRERDGNL